MIRWYAQTVGRSDLAFGRYEEKNKSEKRPPNSVNGIPNFSAYQSTCLNNSYDMLYYSKYFLSLSSAQVFGDEAEVYRLEDVQISNLGRVAEVNVTKDDTVLMRGHGDPSAIKGRIQQIQAEIADCKSEYEVEKMQERVAKLSSGVAVIQVSGWSRT